MGYDRSFSGDVAYVTQRGIPNFTKDDLHSTWRMMNVRCYDDRHKAYPRYGGRGVVVCGEWRWDNPFGFFNFLRDMPIRPKGLTLDRINNDLGYFKDNCKWSTKKEQQNNQSVSSVNSSGSIGVSWSSSQNCWVSQITLLGQTYCLACFNVSDFDKAVDLYNRVKDVKTKLGDEAALDYHLKNKVLTPKGKSLRRNKTSKYYGVCSYKGSRWRAFVNVKFNGKFVQKHLGVFLDEESAYSKVVEELNKISKEYFNEVDKKLEESNSIRH